jgi:hypothetical protein
MYPGNLTLAASLMADEHRRAAERRAKLARTASDMRPAPSALRRLVARISPRHPQPTATPVSLWGRNG